MIARLELNAGVTRPQGLRADDSYEEVDRPGQFDLSGTFTSVLLESTLPSVASFTKVDIPAILEQDVSGNVTSNGWQFPISRHASTFPFPTWGFADEILISEVDCSVAAATVTAATDHSAGWHVKGFGWIPLHTRTSDYSSCNGPCRTTFERSESDGSTEYSMEAYDPYSSSSTASTPSGCAGDGGGGAGGEGTGGAECRSQWVIIEISHDGGGTWETFWEGYADVCG